MQKNSQNFSMQEVLRLANSQAGQQLMAYFKENNPDQLKQLLSQASAGEQKELSKTLSSMLSSPQVQELLRKLEADHG